MTRNDMTAFRTRLEEMTRRLRAEETRLKREVFSDDRERGASTTQEQYTSDDISREKEGEEIALSVLGAEEELLTECVAALERIEQGAFGNCEGCGKAISRKRLDAVPYARRCIRCERARG